MDERFTVTDVNAAAEYAAGLVAGTNYIAEVVRLADELRNVQARYHQALAEERYNRFGRQADEMVSRYFGNSERAETVRRSLIEFAFEQTDNPESLLALWESLAEALRAGGREVFTGDNAPVEQHAIPSDEQARAAQDVAGASPPPGAGEPVAALMEPPPVGARIEQNLNDDRFQGIGGVGVARWPVRADQASDT